MLVTGRAVGVFVDKIPMAHRHYLFMIKKTIILSILAALLFTGCKTPPVGYFSDLENGQTCNVNHVDELIHFRQGDKLSIVVKSKDPLLSELFNLPITSTGIGTGRSSGGIYSSGVSSYTINSHGEIDFPVLGKVKVAGFSREDVAAQIKHQLVSRNLVQDPIVTVEYANLGFNVLGEVSKPGRYGFDCDRLTLLDALSMAGDLSIQGKRENVIVIREQGDHRQAYRVNMLYADSIFQSPAYYLQQNDVVYVEPNKIRARQSTVNGNTVRSASFWISLASLLTSISVLVFK